MTLPESDYQPGNDELARQGRLQDWMKPPVSVPESAWGEAVNGLRAAAAFSTTEPALGQAIPVWLIVENVGDKEIRFGSSDVSQEARPRITRGNGSTVEAKSTWYSGLSPIQRHRLRPGERLTLAKKSLTFDSRNTTNQPGFGGDLVPVGPGEYRVSYEPVLSPGTAWARQADGLMHRTLPAKGEWSGWLKSGATRVFIAGTPEPEPARAVSGLAGATVPKKRESQVARSFLIRVIDADGKPVPDFRVIAGIAFSASRENSAEILSWQPHTLRVGRAGSMTWPLAKAYDRMALRVEADGYAPQVFAWLEKARAHDIEVQLVEDSGIAGRALTPDGKPAAGATVALAMAQREAVLENGWLRHAADTPPEKEADRWRWPRLVSADADGKFRLPPEDDPTAAVLILHENGVREMSLADFKLAPDVTLAAWGRIEGRARWGNVPGTNRSVSLSVHRDVYGYPGVIAQYEKAATGGDEGFVFERVLPGLVQLACPVSVATGTNASPTEFHVPGLSTHLTVRPGMNAARLGGQGRTVTGRLVGRDSWTGVTFHFHPTAPHIGFQGDGELWTAWSAFQKSSLGPAFFRDGLTVNADGTFEIPAVFPGNYQIFFTRAGEKDHLATGQFTVPAEIVGTRPEPQSIGELRCRAEP